MALFTRWIKKRQPTEEQRIKLSQSVSAQVDDSVGWWQMTPHDSGQPAQQSPEAYQDALEAWRKNPLAYRFIAITTDYVVGEGVTISSRSPAVQEFITRFWHHPLNRMDQRLETMCDELSRSGDLFVLLFRNAQDGMSYIRFVTKDRIGRIITAENDWELEQAYLDTSLRFNRTGENYLGHFWYAPQHPLAAAQDAVLLHYAVNRPLGSLMGESDLAPMIPWLQRYSRMLEDRVRLNWAMRAFLWIVTVPAHRVAAKAEQYRSAPESGSIIVKDESETWQPVTPNLNAYDASADLKAIRQMIDAGSHYPPHWRGEPQEVNLATAVAMQAPTEKHLLRRQRYFIHLVKDILVQAYLRAAQAGKAPLIPEEELTQLIEVNAPELSLKDHERLANASFQLANAFSLLATTLQKPFSSTLKRAVVQQVLNFAGISCSDSYIDQVMEEMQEEVS
ncbi:MAG: hypothetical protein ACPL3P_05900 [Anaerolineales bacterium]